MLWYVVCNHPWHDFDLKRDDDKGLGEVPGEMLFVISVRNRTDLLVVSRDRERKVERKSFPLVI